LRTSSGTVRNAWVTTIQPASSPPMMNPNWIAAISTPSQVRIAEPRAA
jgi:hypothetical protein